VNAEVTSGAGRTSAADHGGSDASAPTLSGHDQPAHAVRRQPPSISTGARPPQPRRPVEGRTGRPSSRRRAKSKPHARRRVEPLDVVDRRSEVVRSLKAAAHRALRRQGAGDHGFARHLLRSSATWSAAPRCQKCSQHVSITPRGIFPAPRFRGALRLRRRDERTVSPRTRACSRLLPRASTSDPASPSSTERSGPPSISR